MEPTPSSSLIYVLFFAFRANLNLMSNINTSRYSSELKVTTLIKLAFSLYLDNLSRVGQSTIYY